MPRGGGQEDHARTRAQWPALRHPAACWLDWRLAAEAGVAGHPARHQQAFTLSEGNRRAERGERELDLHHRVVPGSLSHQGLDEWCRPPLKREFPLAGSSIAGSHDRARRPSDNGNCVRGSRRLRQPHGATVVPDANLSRFVGLHSNLLRNRLRRKGARCGPGPRRRARPACSRRPPEAPSARCQRPPSRRSLPRRPQRSC